jgi:glucose/arabinose dehydrogenase
MTNTTRGPSWRNECRAAVTRGLRSVFRQSRWLALTVLPTVVITSIGIAACSSKTSFVADGSSQPDGGSVIDGPPQAEAGAPPDGSFCQQGEDVPGVPVPVGFCLRRFAQLPEARTLVLTPNGDLLVGAPSTSAPGGASGGPGAIVVLVDDDQDGVAEAYTFADQLSDVHGLALGGGYLYFTTQATVWRTPYVVGQRAETGPREDMRMPPDFGAGGRWTHGLARSLGGQLFASRGEYSTCGTSPGGEISSVAMGAATVLATGFRNPMYMRCHPRDEICAATELGEDQMPGAREKLVLVRPETSYGYPCCYTKDLGVPVAGPGACGAVQVADAEFPLSDTPFGLDWERELWPEPYRGALFVALHGSFYSNPPWQGARVVFAKVDPQTRAPVDGWRDFLLGFGPAGTPLERPSDVVFAPDGRLFLADDQGGFVYWMAPLALIRPR